MGKEGSGPRGCRGARRKGTAGEVRGIKSTLGGAAGRGAGAEGRLVESCSLRVAPTMPKSASHQALFCPPPLAKPAIKGRWGSRTLDTKVSSLHLPGMPYPPKRVHVSTREHSAPHTRGAAWLEVGE